MDLHMPVLDGREAIKLIRHDPRSKDVPIVCLTAEAFSDSKKELLMLGANEYLTKPILIHEILNILRKYLKADDEEFEVSQGEEEQAFLPDETREEILKELEILGNTPTFQAEEQLRKIEIIRDLGKGFSGLHFKVLSDLEDAIFNGDELNIKRLCGACQNSILSKYNKTDEVK